MPRALVVTTRERLLRGLLGALAGPDVALHFAPTVDSMLGRRRERDDDVVVLDFATIDETNRRAWLASRPSVRGALVAIVPAERPALLRLALRAGAEALLLDPFDLEECEAAWKRVLARGGAAESNSPSPEALATFLRGLSHHVLNPMSSVTGLLQLQLDDANLPADVKSRSETMMREAQRVVAVVHQIESFVQEARRLQPRRCRLVDVLREMVDGWRRRDPPLVATLDAPDSPVEVKIDRRRVEEALESLVRRAARPDGHGAVVVEARALDGRAIVAVEGSAPTTLPADRDVLFIPFHSEAGPLQPGDPALAAAWGTLRAHGGTLIVEPSKTGGVRFVATLPTAAPTVAGEDVGGPAQSK